MKTKEELNSWTKEKLVDELLKYMHEDEHRKEKTREWGKAWRAKQKKELEELRQYKAQKAAAPTV